MTTARTGLVPGSTAASLSLGINRSLEALWLLAVFLVPLAFLDGTPEKPWYAVSEAAIAYVEVPKIALLRILAGLMAVLWLVEWAIQGRLSFGPLRRGQWGQFRPGTLLPALAGWLRGRPVRWLFLAVWFYLATTLLSTIVSTSLEVSLWGEIPGQDSYPAYTVAAYLVLFGVIATHLRTKAQLWRLLGAIVAMGVVVAGYGVLQRYGRDFLGLTEITGGGAQRVTSFMGNTLFAASVMLMAISVSVMVATVTLREPAGTPGAPLRKIRAWILALAAPGCWMLVLTVELLGLTFTFSRGPWLGTIAALLGFLGLAAAFVGWRALVRGALVLALPAMLILALVQGEEILSLLSRNLWIGGLLGAAVALVLAATFAGRRILVRVALVLGLAVVVAVAVLLVPLWFKGGAGLGGDPSSPLTVTGQAVETAVETFASIGSQVSSGVIGGRVDIWKGSWAVIRDRPWFAFDSLSLPWIRPFLGYGPDLFRYTFLLRSPRGPLSADLLPPEADQAHNYFIHQAVEQGYLGLLSSLGIFVAVFGVGLYQLLRERHGYSTAHKLVLIGLLATMAGRFVEQMTGVARVSDLTLFWILLAVFAALPVVMRGPEGMLEPAPRPEGRRRGNPGPRSPRRERPAADSGLIWRLAVVAWLVGGIAMVTWVKGFNYPRAALVVGQGVDHYRRGELQASLAAFDQATALAPDVPVYYTYKALVYSAYRRFEQVSPERECSLQTKMDYQICLAVQAYLNNQQALEQRPFYWRSREALAKSAFNLKRYDESIRLHQEVLALAPTSWPLRVRLAEVYIKAGQPQLALEPLKEALAVTKDTELSLLALFYLGWAYRDLGRPEQSVQTLELLPDTTLSPQVHLMLTEVYESLGQLEPAQKHLERAAEAYIKEGLSQAAIDASRKFLARAGNQPRSARVYYLQGRAYRDLGDPEKASQSLERSLELGLLGDEGRDAHHLLAEIYARLGRLNLVEKHREQLVQDYLAAGDRGSASGHLELLAAAYLERGQPEKALQTLQRSLALDLAGDLTPSADTFFLQGLAYLAVGEREKAVESLERSIRLNPSSKFAPQAQRVAAEIYVRLGRLDLAEAHLKLLAKAYLETGRPKEALEALEGLAAVATGGTGPTEVSFLRGLVYRDLDQLEKSIQSLKLSLELSPSGETARQAHRTLSEIYAKLGRNGLAKTHQKLYQELGRP